MRRLGCRPAVRQRCALASTLGRADGSLVGSVRGEVPPPPLQIYRNAVSEEDECTLVAQADSFFRHQPYLGGHFDNVIVNYRELQKPLHTFKPASRLVRCALQRLASQADISMEHVSALSSRRANPVADPRTADIGDLSDRDKITTCPPTRSHALRTHLSPRRPRRILWAVQCLALTYNTSVISRSNPSVYMHRYIVGLSLLSDAVMTLHHEAQPNRAGNEDESAAPGRHVANTPPQMSTSAWLPMLLPRRSLYVLHDEARYDWAHAVPSEPEWEGVAFEKGRRLTILFRDQAAAEVEQHEGASNSTASNSTASRR